MQFLYSFTKEINLKNKILKPDISCGIIDLKYDENALKILEFGEIEFSAFKGHEALYGQGQIWGNLWQYLAKFKKPIWYVSSKGSSRSNDKAIEVLYNVGGIRSKSFEELEKNAFFKQQCENYLDNNGSKTHLQDYAGIIVIKNRSKRKDSLNEIKNLDKFIILNDKFTKYGENKHNCASLFESDNLAEFKPKWQAYSFIYNKNLAKKILSDLQGDTLVIKPVNSTRGQGVIIVEKENLDKILNKILNHKNLDALSDDERYLDSDYVFWQQYKEEKFLVETFEKSKNITVNKKIYDATMRIVFVMSCEEQNKEKTCTKKEAFNNLIEFNIIGAYWKLPEKDVNSSCSLNNMHKSKISETGISSAKVEPEDINCIGETFEKIIPEIYKKILEY